MVAQQKEPMDAEKIKSAVDCRLLVESVLGIPKLRAHDYAQWLCPFHAEKTPSFTVWANGFKCFGGCGWSGDTIEWVRRYYNKSSFQEAALWLADYANLSDDDIRKSNYRDNHTTIVRRPEPEKLEVATPPTQEWQERVMKVVERAEEILWSEEGEQAFNYLHDDRGLWNATIKAARLGFVPDVTGKGFIYWGGLKIPCGITIPWIVDGHLWGVKVRRGNGKHPKYLPISTQDHLVAKIGKGQHPRSLYWADQMVPNWPLLITEGEFDCLIAWQDARELVCPVTVGPAGHKINPRWYAQLATMPRWYACYDPDTAGDKAGEALANMTERAVFIHVPLGKDINEYHTLTSDMDVYDWIESVVTTKPVPTR